MSEISYWRKVWIKEMRIKQMTELSFLIELLLNHDLPKATKDLLADRIKEVEYRISENPIHKPISVSQPIHNTGPKQAPSTLANMAKQEGITFVPPPEVVLPPVTQIAQTPATAEALNYRNNLLNKAQNHTFETKANGKGIKGPRKW